MFKVLYKLIMASGLAISQQTQIAVSIIKQENINTELDQQSEALCTFKNKFLMDGGLKDLKKIIECSY